MTLPNFQDATRSQSCRLGTPVCAKRFVCGRIAIVGRGEALHRTLPWAINSSARLSAQRKGDRTMTHISNIEEAVDYSRDEHAVRVIGFERRLVATLIDGALIFLASFFVVLAIGILGIFSGAWDNREALPADRLLPLAGIIISLAYYIGYWKKSGQTPGKSIMEIKVIATDGSPLSWGRALARYVGYIVSAIFLSVGFLWIAFDQKRQGWHDKMAGTCVAFVDDEVIDPENVKLVPEDTGHKWGWFTVWLVFVLLLPGALTASLWILGPSVNKALHNLIDGLR